ncbi:hypothetical protein TNCV_2889691 [Trichonephila clavipes]|nr:hypothetical protein TNCV_2889691 [Trichonephila clavipes]
MRNVRKKLIEWCMKEGLIALNYECSKCNERMGLYERKSAVLEGDFEWVCSTITSQNIYGRTPMILLTMRPSRLFVKIRCNAVASTRKKISNNFDASGITRSPLVRCEVAPTVHAPSFRFINQTNGRHICIRLCWIRDVSQTMGSNEFLYSLQKNPGSHWRAHIFRTTADKERSTQLQRWNHVVSSSPGATEDSPYSRTEARSMNRASNSQHYRGAEVWRVLDQVSRS